MDTQLLIQILILISIVAIVMLIAVLWRCFNILGDIKEITTITSKRVNEIDTGIDRAIASIKNWQEIVKGFIYSLDFIKNIRKKFEK